MPAVPKGALPGQRADVRKGAVESLFSLPQTQFAEAGRINHDSSARENEELARCRRMPALPIRTNISYDLPVFAQ